MAFHDIRFPDDIAFGARGGPVYRTEVVTTAGGYEQRQVQEDIPRARYQIAYGIRTQTQMATVIAFFRARQGRAYGFRFRDWSDYQAFGQSLGSGDDMETQFQLVKSYSSGAVSLSRTITRPVSSSVAVYLDGAAAESGWSLDDSTGVVTFDVAPGGGVAVTADFEFDVPVRFDTDRLEVRLDGGGAGNWSNIPLVELR